jgi:transposase
MPRGTELTDYEKGQIDARRANGHGYGTIAEALGRSKDAIQNYVTGRFNYGQKRRSGRAKKLIKRDERAIGRAASNSTKSVNDIKREIGTEASKTTVWRAIKRNPVIVRAKMMKTPKLTSEHKTRRLNFAKENMARDWSKVSPGDF